MLIVQISDLHIAPPGQKTLGVAPMAENLALCIERINQLTPKADLVMITGDIADDGTGAAAQNAASLLQRLHAPYYVIPGNHDNRDVVWSVFGGQACPQRTQGFLSYVIEINGLHLIALDSVRAGAPGGEICEIRAAWLETRLSETAGRPTALFMHHPPVRFGIAETDLDGFIGVERLGGIMARHSNIEGIFCGHIHLPAHTRWQGTYVSTAPSMGMRLVPDLTLENPSRFVLEAPGFQILRWSENQPLVTHTVYATTPQGPFDF